MADHTYQQKLRESEDEGLRLILESVYRDFFPPRSVERVEYDSSAEFQSGGRNVKITLKAPRGRAYVQTIEEKIRSPRRSGYPDLCVEYLSNAERGTLGCICTSKADWLAYVRQPESEVVVAILPMQLFKRWFRARLGNYKDLPSHCATRLNNGNRYTTRSKVVPWEDEEFRAFRMANGCFVKSVRRPKRNAAQLAATQMSWI